MTHQETHLPLDRAACCTETSVKFSNNLTVIYQKTWIFFNTVVRNTYYAKIIRVHTDDCTYMVVWSGALILFLAIMKSLLLHTPSTFMVALNDYIYIRCHFSGCVHNMVNGKRMEHQYRVDKKALYTHQLTVWICMWMLYATLSVPLHMTGTYCYIQCCHTPPSIFTVCHATPHAHTVWRGRYIREQ